MAPLALLRAAGARYRFDGAVIERGVAPILVVLGLMLLTIAWCVAGGAIDCRIAEVAGIFALIVLLWCSGLAFQLIALRPVGEAVKAFSLFLALSVAAALASAALAPISAPYADEAFVRADRLLLGFDWPSAVVALDGNRLLTAVLGRAYASLIWQPAALIVYFCVVRRSDRAWRVLSALAVALGLCIAIFPFCPAVGGYAHFHIGWDAVPNVPVGSAWRYPALLDKLKTGPIDTLGSDTLDGIVAMPSFHAASAVILAWGFWASRLLRWPFLVLDTAMIVSTVPIGGHYIVDVLAGAGAAGIAILPVARSIRRDAARGGARPAHRIYVANPIAAAPSSAKAA